MCRATVLLVTLFSVLVYAPCSARTVSDLINSGEIAQCFINQSTLQLANKSLTSLDGIEQIKGANITFIDCSDNHFEVLEAQSFRNFPQLNHLSFNKCHIKNIDAFEQCTGLKQITTLELANNNLSIIAQKALVNMQNLEFLLLNHNRLTKLPALHMLTNLRELHATHNSIAELDINTLVPLSNLYVLNLGHNAIHTITPSLTQPVKNIEMLFLNDNIITELAPYVFAQCNRLKGLYLHNNKIQRIDSTSFTRLSKLRLLYLHNNALTTLHKNMFHDLSNLRILFLCNNPLTTLEAYWNHGLSSLYALDMMQDQELTLNATNMHDCLSTIDAIMQRYTRPLTILVLDAPHAQTYCDLAQRYDCCVVFMHSTQRDNHSITGDNTIVIGKPITDHDLQELGSCEHFDIVIAHPTDSWSSIHQAVYKLGDHTFVLATPQQQMTWRMSRKIVLNKPTWQSPNERFYAITSNYTDKTLYKPRKNEVVPWVKGINLWTFTKLGGIYPNKQTVHNEIRRLAAYPHEDFMPWNMIVQGNSLELIDWNDPNAPANMHNANACITQLE